MTQHLGDTMPVRLIGAAEVDEARTPLASGTLYSMNPMHPKKLLLSKWTAVHPVAREKHFLVSKVILPETPGGKIEWVEVEAVHSNVVRRIAWRELCDDTHWRQGWL
jgi:tryptophan-rich hypothetical protein